LFKSNFAKNVALVSAGTALAQFMGVLFSPILTRLFTPDEFGIFMLYNSFLGVFLIIGTFKYENCIPIAQNKIVSINTIALSVIILWTISTMLFFTFLLFNQPLLGLFNASSLGYYALLIPLGLLFSGIYQILLQWALRTKNFKKITYTKVLQGFGQNLSQVGFGLLNVGSIGLIIGQIIGRSAGSYTMFKKLKNSDPQIFNYISISKMKWVARRYRHFPMITAPSQLLSKGGLELPIFFLTFIFSVAVVGQYGLANMIVNIPVVLIGTAIGDVFYSEAATYGVRNPKKLIRLSNKLILRLILLGIVPMFILLLFGPFLFSTIFGKDWIDAGYYAQILAVLAFFRLTFTPVSRVFLVYEKHFVALLTNIIRVFMVVICFLLVIIFHLSSFEAIMIYAGSMSIVYLMTYIFARRIILKQIENVSNP